MREFQRCSAYIGILQYCGYYVIIKQELLPEDRVKFKMIFSAGFFTAFRMTLPLAVNFIKMR